MKNLFKLIAIFTLLLILGVASFFAWASFSDIKNEPVACTMEAMQCSDGSYVGRSGPNCEFTACPATPGFNEELSFSVGKKITLEDGLKVTLAQINDSRCKEGVVCVWAGEISAQFTITGGAVGGAGKEVLLGTSTAKTKTTDGYVFELKNATPTTVEIIITKSVQPLGACYIGGCSSEICSDKDDVVSACMYKEEFACYKTATCERQQNGQCGWTQTPALATCIANSR